MNYFRLQKWLLLVNNDWPFYRILLNVKDVRVQIQKTYVFVQAKKRCLPW